MRHNIFNEGYKQLKVSLVNTCIALSNNENTTAAVSKEIIEKVTESLRLTKEQVVFEAANILPLIFEYEPSVWDLFTREHHKVMNLHTQLEQMVKTFSYCTNELIQVDLIAAIGEAFNHFIMIQYNHMDDEEAILNEILWRHYSDETLKQVNDYNTVILTLLKNQKYKTAKAA
jgi:hypothetical protein